MATNTNTYKEFCIKMTAGWDYTWRAKAEAYPSTIATELGVKELGANDKPVLGANSPKPPRVRINFVGGGSIIRFCSPDKVEDVTTGRKLKGKTYNSKTISSASKL